MQWYVTYDLEKGQAKLVPGVWNKQEAIDIAIEDIRDTISCHVDDAESAMMDLEDYYNKLKKCRKTLLAVKALRKQRIK